MSTRLRLAHLKGDFFGCGGGHSPEKGKFAGEYVRDTGVVQQREGVTRFGGP